MYLSGLSSVPSLDSMDIVTRTRKIVMVMMITDIATRAKTTSDLLMWHVISSHYRSVATNL